MLIHAHFFFISLLAFAGVADVVRRRFAAEADPDLMKALSDSDGNGTAGARRGGQDALQDQGGRAGDDASWRKKATFAKDELKSSAALALAESDDAGDRCKAAAKALPLPMMKDGKQIVAVSKLV